MLVEDQEHDVIAFRRALAKDGKAWDVTHVVRAEEALKLLAQNALFSIIVTDFNLPGMNGLEFVEALGSLESRPPVLFITGAGSESIAVQALKLGVDDYIVKDPSQGYLQILPIKIPEILQHHKNALEKEQARAQLAEANEQFLAVLEGLIAGVNVVDLETLEILFANKYYRDIYGDSIIGKHCWDVLMEGESSPCEHCINASLLGNDGKPAAALVQERQDHATGKWFLDQNTAIRWTNGRWARLQISTDITDMKAAELLRNDMDGILRHDLRSPLSGLLSVFSILGGEGCLDDQLQELVDSGKQSTYRMLSMVNMTFDLFKIEGGAYQVETEKVPLKKLLLRAMAGQKEMAASLGVTLKTAPLMEESEPYNVLGEESLCYSIFHNLIANAVEAGDSGDFVAVQMGKTTSEVTVKVLNPAKVPEQVKERFFDKYATSGKTKGTGLGAYAAKLLTEAQGGRISMSSSAEQGTVVTVTLPAADAD